MTGLGLTRRYGYSPGWSEAKILVDGLAALLGDLKANRAPGFLLPDGGSLHRVAMGRDVLNFQAHHIAAAKLAVDVLNSIRGFSPFTLRSGSCCFARALHGARIRVALR